MIVILHFLAAILYKICWHLMYCYSVYSIRRRKLKWLPSVPGLPVVGAALEFGDDTKLLEQFGNLIKRHGEIVSLDIFMESNIITTDYDFVEYVLGTHEVLSKSIDYRYLHKWLGDGLLTSDGQKWKERRKLTTPAFHYSILEKFIDVFEQNLDILIPLLEEEAKMGAMDLYPHLNRYALDVVCEAAMGVSVDAQKNKESRYTKNVREICRITMERIFSLVKKYDALYVFCSDFYTEQKVVRELHAVTNSVIDARKQELELKGNEFTDDIDGVGQKKRLAFLDILLRSTVDGEPLSKEDIREEVDTFMFEGHDTVSSALGFSLHLLATHPEVQRTAVDEQRHIFEDDLRRRPTYKDLQDMKYLEMVIKETLRLYPPVPLYGRVTTADIQYKGNIIPKDVNLLILTYSIHRDPKYFKNPEKFDPGRFENSDGTRPYSYIPFSAGPRNCIGQKFAMLELKSVLSRVLRTFELSPSSVNDKLIIIAEAVLKSKNGIRLNLTKREWEK